MKTSRTGGPVRSIGISIGLWLITIKIGVGAFRFRECGFTYFGLIETPGFKKNLMIRMGWLAIQLIIPDYSRYA
jgi:hypothetical protein